MEEQKYVVVLYENEYWFLDISPEKFKENKENFENPIVDIYQTKLDLTISENENRKKPKTMVTQIHFQRLILMTKDKKDFDKKIPPILKELLAGYSLIQNSDICSFLAWKHILTGAKAITKLLQNEEEKILFFKAIYFLTEVVIRSNGPWVITQLIKT